MNDAHESKKNRTRSTWNMNTPWRIIKECLNSSPKHKIQQRIYKYDDSATT